MVSQILKVTASEKAKKICLCAGGYICQFAKSYIAKDYGAMYKEGPVRMRGCFS